MTRNFISTVRKYLDIGFWISQVSLEFPRRSFNVKQSFKRRKCNWRLAPVATYSLLGDTSASLPVPATFCSGTQPSNVVPDAHEAYPKRCQTQASVTLRCSYVTSISLPKQMFSLQMRYVNYILHMLELLKQCSRFITRKADIQCQVLN